MTIKIQAPSVEEELKPRIVVVGVGGAGGNAVNNMIRSNLEGVEFIVANTDAQALKHSDAERKIQLGATVTKGLGAGARPEIGQQAAIETMEETLDHLQGANMVFITAGMGGGTGTGAAPVIAEAAREAGMLTVGVVTRPFQFEGVHRMKAAEKGIAELQKFVDTLIIIPNQNLFRVANEKTTFADAFKMADDVLYSGVRGVTDLMVMPGLINLDFADIRTVMGEMGKAMMGTGEAEGENRAIVAAESAISNPLLEDVSMKGARGVLINITGGADMTLFEVDEAANRIREEVDADANIIFGSTFDESLEGLMRVSVVATGIDGEAYQGISRQGRNLPPMSGQTVPVAPVDSPNITGDAAPIPETANTDEVAAQATAEASEAIAAQGMDTLDPAGHADNNDGAETIETDAVAQEETATALPPTEGQVDDLADHSADHEDVTETARAQENIASKAREADLFELDDLPTNGTQTQPAAPSQATTEGAPEPVRPRDAFIPPKPVKVERENASLREEADAFAEAAMANGSVDPEKGPSKPKAKSSLFSRVTGLGLGVGKDEGAQTARHRKASEPSLLRQADGRTPQQTVAAERAAQQQSMEEQSSQSQADEEMLEIPSFLRRQAN